MVTLTFLNTTRYITQHYTIHPFILSSVVLREVRRQDLYSHFAFIRNVHYMREMTVDVTMKMKADFRDIQSLPLSSW